MSARYRKVSQNETELAEEEQKKQKSERLERITSKIHAFLWVALSVLIIYFTDLWDVVLHDGEINRYAAFSSHHCFCCSRVL
jgi:hypothetical protein